MNKTFGQFKADFDLMYNNINNAAAPGFTNDEIAQLAQMSTEEVCKGVYDGTLKGEGFEVTEEVTSYINGLTQQKLFTEDGENKFEVNPSTILDIPIEDFNARKCQLDDNLWFIVFESVKYKDSDTCFGGKQVGVKPITHDSAYRIMRNPFVGRNSNYVSRLLLENKVELLSWQEEIAEYLVRFMTRPTFKVALYDITINGTTKQVPWKVVDNAIDYDNTPILQELNDSLYRIIVRQTVNNAKNIWAS